MKLRSLSIAVILGAFGLAACGSDTTASPSTGATAAASTMPMDSKFNDSDVAFAKGMIPHHQQAVEMADIALDPKAGASEQVRDLATRIKAGQDPEIAKMTGWLTAWGEPMAMTTDGGHDMATMDGMMSTAEMDSLRTLTGTAFDKMWMEMMIRHHESAIAMAQTVKGAGSDPDVLALADQVIAAQQGEIAEMKALLGS